MSQEIQTSTGRWWLDESSQIIRFDHARGSVTTLAEAKENLNAFCKLFGETRPPVLIDITKCKAIDREARAYYAGQGRKLFKGGALLSKTPIGNIIGNIWLSLYGHDHIKLFTSEREAIAWLKGLAKE
jgi:hypothetical protein